jgi:hypothetical protein
MVFLALAAIAVEGQPRQPVRTERFQVRIQSGGSELLALRNAPVVYTTLEQLSRVIEQQLPSRAVPLRVIRASPQQTIDYVLGVTREGTLVIGQQLYTLDLAQDRYVFTRGEIARSYPAVDRINPWMWLVEVPLSREVNVTLELRSTTLWPVESVTITASHVP